MIRILIIAALVVVPVAACAAGTRHRPHGICTPVYIEGAGTVRICAPARGR